MSKERLREVSHWLTLTQLTGTALRSEPTSAWMKRSQSFHCTKPRTIQYLKWLRALIWVPPKADSEAKSGHKKWIGRWSRKRSEKQAVRRGKGGIPIQAGYRPVTSPGTWAFILVGSSRFCTYTPHTSAGKEAGTAIR